MKKQSHWIIGLACVATQALGTETWRFITLADWHWAEGYVWQEKFPDRYTETLKKHTADVAALKSLFGGELLLLPGDSNGGHWDRPDFIKGFLPGATAEESVLKAGHLCYSGMIQAFKDGGYSKLIMAVGDHELGDNPWPAGSAVARCQPQFRQAFAREFNINPDGGRFLYDKPIGKAASRPLGTPYADTSYAYRHKNALFVTVDVFHQESPDKVLGDEGTVTGAVAGEHLQWLESVLAEARKDPSIKHIFVQAHLPVIYPVRKVSSSGMLMDAGAESPFWQVLRKHKVDIYFAGEVHANTVTKDPGSDLVQVVSRGNFFDNLLTVDVSDDRIELVCRNQAGEEASDGKYTDTGRLVIDKRGGKTVLDGEGELAFLDPSARLFHFDFEGDVAMKDLPIMGFAGREKKEDAKTIRGVECARIFTNRGEFGRHFSALQANVELIDGPRGKAGRFDEESRMAVFAMGPHHGSHAVSYALWIKTVSGENQLLVNSGSIWSKVLQGFFNLNLNDGVPEVMVSRSQRLLAEGVKLNDGQWHHLAVAMPKDGCLLSEVRMYADGKPLATKLVGTDLPLRFNQAVRMSFGGLGYSNKGFDALPVKPFVGSMDEISIWARAVDGEEISKLLK